MLYINRFIGVLPARTSVQPTERISLCSYRGGPPDCYHMVKKLWQYVKPFSSNPGTSQTDRQTDRTAISISHVSVLTRDKNGETNSRQTCRQTKRQTSIELDQYRRFINNDVTLGRVYSWWELQRRVMLKLSKPVHNTAHIRIHVYVMYRHDHSVCTTTGVNRSFWGQFYVSDDSANSVIPLKDNG